jgi:hypothetical protein
MPVEVALLSDGPRANHRVHALAGELPAVIYVGAGTCCEAFAAWVGEPGGAYPSRYVRGGDGAYRYEG